MGEIITRSERETMEFAESLCKSLKMPSIVCLKGQLGSGKTVFVKGFAHALGLDRKAIKSPTYTYVRQYKIKGGFLYHFDFYRISELDDLMSHELKELLARKNAYFLIEWPEKLNKLEIPGRIDINIDYLNEKERIITM
jgi:tRNA threonylcarbamoyladenosine biosynthesis protein TsaE